jgi:cytoskeletal protein RodZ
VEDIGSTLREARMRAHIDISEVETRTKIRARYLRAMENEEWDLLPGPVYVKSFLRTYGDFLGLDSRMLVEDYKRRYERSAEVEQRPIATLGHERTRAGPSLALPPWAVIGVVLLALVVVLYIVGSNANKSSNTPPTGTRAGAGQHRAAHKPTPAVTTPTTPTVAKLELVPTGPVYVCLVDGSGKKLVNEQTFNVGQTIPTASAPKMLLTLGNANVKMTVNGQPVTVTPSASAIRYLIGPGTPSTRPIRQSATPTCP